MADNMMFDFMPATRAELEEVKKILKELIETNKKQMQFFESLQKQINLTQEQIKLIRKLI